MRELGYGPHDMFVVQELTHVLTGNPQPITTNNTLTVDAVWYARFCDLTPVAVAPHHAHLEGSTGTRVLHLLLLSQRDAAATERFHSITHFHHSSQALRESMRLSAPSLPQAAATSSSSYSVQQASTSQSESEGANAAATAHILHDVVEFWSLLHTAVGGAHGCSMVSWRLLPLARLCKLTFSPGCIEQPAWGRPRWKRDAPSSCVLWRAKHAK
mmetsp:Transcript_31264/g.51764  ORF Transcript_31264/g.51764 Transcript_31264/m.51764 type:complete len:214 (+) Transcript_31264:149-790(+)